MEPSPNSFHCPLCHSIDSVTKVSSIVDNGSAVHVGYFAAGRSSGTSVTTSMTDLARKLAPPSLPRYRVAAEGYNGIATVLMIIFGLLIAGLGWSMGQSSTGGSASSNELTTLIFVLLGLGFALYPIISLTVVAILRNKKRPRWRQARAIWEQLYYCTRNDVVFLPGAPQHCVPTSQMSTLLYPPQVQVPQSVSLNGRF